MSVGRGRDGAAAHVVLLEVQMMMHRVVPWVAVLAVTMSCARRIPEPAGQPPGVGHVSWIIMHGNRDNPDAEFACQSTGPRECVLPASRPDRRVFSDVHLYFHGAGNVTTYEGAYQLEFFDEGAEPNRDFPIRTTVRGNRSITNHSVTGIVTAAAGEYAFRLALDATTPARSVPILERIPVQVR